MMMTRKEACGATGYGLTWLKSHQCAWCEQQGLAALMYGCASIYGPRCDVVRRFKRKDDKQCAEVQTRTPPVPEVP